MHNEGLKVVSLVKEVISKKNNGMLKTRAGKIENFSISIFFRFRFFKIFSISIFQNFSISIFSIIDYRFFFILNFKVGRITIVAMPIFGIMIHN